jgi:hypothetical protein
MSTEHRSGLAAVFASTRGVPSLVPSPSPNAHASISRIVAEVTQQTTMTFLGVPVGDLNVAVDRMVTARGGMGLASDPSSPGDLNAAVDRELARRG